MDDINDRLRDASGDRANPTENRDQVAERDRGAAGPYPINVDPRISVGPRIREAEMKIKNNVRTDVRGEVFRQIQRPPFMDSRSRQMFRDALGGDRER